MGALLKRAATAFKRAVDLRDAFGFGGIACVAYGLAQIYPPAAWIVTGAMLCWLGLKGK